MKPCDAQTLSVSPIGFVRTGLATKFDAPSQPDQASAETHRIELLPGKQFELALDSIAGFDRIWIVSWFDRNTNWRPRVLPPRGPAIRRGVFATRSPHRPNPIGLTCARLLSVEGLMLEVGALDLVDGTPVLDIKPYVRTVDSFPDSSLGWIEDVNAADQAEPQYAIQVSDLAARQLDWLARAHGIDFTDRAFGVLRRNPLPHRTRRILQLAPNQYRMACGPWRLFFTLEADVVRVESVGKGHSDKALLAEGFDKILHRDAQFEFGAKSWLSSDGTQDDG